LEELMLDRFLAWMTPERWQKALGLAGLLLGILMAQVLIPFPPAVLLVLILANAAVGYLRPGGDTVLVEGATVRLPDGTTGKVVRA
jgi:hypothetical protein